MNFGQLIYSAAKTRMSWIAQVHLFPLHAVRCQSAPRSKQSDEFQGNVWNREAFEQSSATEQELLDKMFARLRACDGFFNSSSTNTVDVEDFSA